MANREEDAQRARHWLHELATQPMAPVTRRPAKGKVFIDATIEGQRFQGICDGNTLHLVGPDCGCALGVTSINRVGPASGRGGDDWRLCKYGNEGNLFPLTLSESGRRALAASFGLPIVPLRGRVGMVDLFEREMFYESPAFAALQEWANAAPRRIAGAYGDSYLGLWPISALDGAYVPPTPENVARARARIAPPVAAHG
jgi:hypothetical protein